MIVSTMLFLLHFSVFVAACAAVPSPPPGAIVVAKSGGDLDTVSRCIRYGIDSDAD
jgi:tripartite-type tricarboxylate transporter receptor subunit TctC